MKREVTQNNHMSVVLKSRVKTQDTKLLFVPVVFMVLRIWSIAVDICVYYLPDEAKCRFRENLISAVLSVLEASYDSTVNR